MKKTIAGYFKKITKEDGSIEEVFIEQQDVDMSPEEEAEMLALWAVGDAERLLPTDPTIDEKLEMLIEHGPGHVKQKMKEHEDLKKPMEIAIKEAQQRHMLAHGGYVKSHEEK